MLFDQSNPKWPIESAHITLELGPEVGRVRTWSDFLKSSMPHLKSEFLKISWNDVIPKSPHLYLFLHVRILEENLGVNRLPCGSALESEHGMDGLPHTHTSYQPSNCEKGRLTYSAQKQTAGVVFISYRQWQPRTSCLVRRCPQTWEKWYGKWEWEIPF